MPANVPVPDHAAGDVFTEAMWDLYIKENVNKLLDRGHRVLSVAAFLALTGLEDGDEAYVEVDGTNGIVWHLRYHLATTKWRFLGGAPMRAEVTTDETASTTGYTDLGTVGPSVTVPMLGDYDVFVNAAGWDTFNPSQNVKTAVKVGAAATADAEGMSHMGSSASPGLCGIRRMRKAALAASTVLKVQYSRATGTSHWANRVLEIQPARIG